jgi:hypothetical protein
VSCRGIDLFGEPGMSVMQALEKLNGGALETVGIVVFEKLGITTGRLDQAGRENHSVTAFRQGLWAAKTDEMRAISFSSGL